MSYIDLPAPPCGHHLRYMSACYGDLATWDDIIERVTKVKRAPHASFSNELSTMVYFVLHWDVFDDGVRRIPLGVAKLRFPMKIYHTEAERKEAHRARNRVYYQRHRVQILGSKKSAREHTNSLQAQIKIKERQKSKEKRRSQGRSEGGSQTEAGRLSLEDPQTVRRRELLDMLDDLKLEYTNFVQPWPYPFLDELCIQAMAWQKRSSLSNGIMFCDLSQCPILLADARIMRMMNHFEGLEEEFLYSIQGRDERSWEHDIGLFRMFRDEASKMIQALRDLQGAVESNSLKDRLDDGTLVYQSIYSPRVTSIFAVD
ncbi:hypothetical protein PQX77_015725 [Marasmius sp. AFHP31]|nr:hypothetical protein PQX77_015725 [Marasmius sp. AFHP31]